MNLCASLLSGSQESIEQVKRAILVQVLAQQAKILEASWLVGALLQLARAEEQLQSECSVRWLSLALSGSIDPSFSSAATSEPESQ